MSYMRILIVEDDSEAANYMVKAFREAGHVADHVDDGLEGYARARTKPTTSSSSTACCRSSTGSR